MATKRFGAYTTEVLDNMAATEAPGVSADGVAGYAVGSKWIDVTADTAYICVDASTGAALWDIMTAVALTPSVEVWTGITNDVELRVLDCDDTSIDELADIVGTLADDLVATGILAAA
jgi:hypothetical protein